MRKNCLETAGFLMMSHMAEPSKIVEQAKIMVNVSGYHIYQTRGCIITKSGTDRIEH